MTNHIDESRSQISSFVKNGFVKVDGKIVTKPGYKLKQNQKVECEFPTTVESKSDYAVDFDIEVLYEDEHLMVINKPTGITVHSAPSVKEATVVDWLKKQGVSLSTISGEERHGIVHRLDKGTTGAMVVAKTNEAHKELSKQLQDKSMGRYYLAVVVPPLKEDTVIEKPIARNPNNRLKMSCVSGGKEAKTAFKILANSHDEKMQLVACKLFTGRTHQIRVHLETINRHIAGDELYGGSSKGKIKSEHILLHAYIIYFIHPATGKKVFFKANLDKIFKKFLEDNFDMEMVDEILQADNITGSFDSFV